MSARPTQIHPAGAPACHVRPRANYFAGEASDLAREGSAAGFCLYLLFTVSWFVHLAARIPTLGAIRFDLLLIALIVAAWFIGGAGLSPAAGEQNGVDLILKLLCVYIVLSVPFQTWPGSALFAGLPNFIKAVVFYFFTVWFITSQPRLKVFVAVLVACQCFRVFEPVYLHIASGYWGDKAYMDGGLAFMNRLSGAPNDTVNPNGLAFVIDMAVSLLFFLALTSRTWAAAALISIPICLYALVLTGSRSGMIGLFAVMVAILIKSNHKIAIGLLFVLIAIIGFARMSANDQDRYLSIVDSKTQNSDTFQGRIEGLKRDLHVALKNPIFGNGIGTSREANANFAGNDQPSHNLYIEVWEELGIWGLIIYICFIISIFKSIMKSAKSFQNNSVSGSYLLYISNGLQACLFMTFLFSFASYGLSLDIWYLLAGLSVVQKKLGGI